MKTWILILGMILTGNANAQVGGSGIERVPAAVYPGGCAALDNTNLAHRGFFNFLANIAGDYLSASTIGSAFRVGDAISFKACSTPSGISIGTTYYIITIDKTTSANTTRFQISATPGGGALDLTAAGECALSDGILYGVVEFQLAASSSLQYSFSSEGTTFATVAISGATNSITGKYFVTSGIRGNVSAGTCTGHTKIYRY